MNMRAVSSSFVASCLALVLVLSVPVGCGKVEAGSSTSFNLWHDGLLRTYRLYVPANHDDSQAAPLLFMLHGGGGGARQIQNNSARMDAEADRTGMLVVYPDGFMRTWNAGGCCGAAANRQVDDVGFLLAVLEKVSEVVNVDRARVYASGMSNGGIMSYALACAHPEVIAAIAPVAGTRMVGCDNGAVVPVMHVHGTEDKLVPWEGGQGCGPTTADFTSVEASVGLLADHAGCLADSEVVSNEQGVECTRRMGCRAGQEVMLCKVQGGGHDWPGGDESPELVRGMCPEDGTQNMEWNASGHIVDFLLRHRLPDR